VVDKAGAFLFESDHRSSQWVVAAQEQGKPSLVNVVGSLQDGQVVTADFASGRIYDGRLALLQAADPVEDPIRIPQEDVRPETLAIEVASASNFYQDILKIHPLAFLYYDNGELHRMEQEVENKIEAAREERREAERRLVALGEDGAQERERLVSVANERAKLIELQNNLLREIRKLQTTIRTTISRKGFTKAEDYYRTQLIAYFNTAVETGQGGQLVYRTSDLDSEGYLALQYGSWFGAPEENTPLGFGGFYRYVSSAEYRTLLSWELEAVKEARRGGIDNIGVELADVRDVSHLEVAKTLLQEADLRRGHRGFKLGLQAMNMDQVLFAREYAEAVDFVSIHERMLAQNYFAADLRNPNVPITEADIEANLQRALNMIKTPLVALGKPLAVEETVLRSADGGQKSLRELAWEHVAHIRLSAAMKEKEQAVREVLANARVRLQQAYDAGGDLDAVIGAQRDARRSLARLLDRGPGSPMVSGLITEAIRGVDGRSSKDGGEREGAMGIDAFTLSYFRELKAHLAHHQERGTLEEGFAWLEKTLGIHLSRKGKTVLSDPDVSDFVLASSLSAHIAERLTPLAKLDQQAIRARLEELLSSFAPAKARGDQLRRYRLSQILDAVSEHFGIPRESFAYLGVEPEADVDTLAYAVHETIQRRLAGIQAFRIQSKSAPMSQRRRAFVDALIRNLTEARPASAPTLLPVEVGDLATRHGIGVQEATPFLVGTGVFLINPGNVAARNVTIDRVDRERPRFDFLYFDLSGNHDFNQRIAHVQERGYAWAESAHDGGEKSLDAGTAHLAAHTSVFQPLAHALHDTGTQLVARTSLFGRGKKVGAIAIRRTDLAKAIKDTLGEDQEAFFGFETFDVDTQNPWIDYSMSTLRTQNGKRLNGGAVRTLLREQPDVALVQIPGEKGKEGPGPIDTRQFEETLNAHMLELFRERGIDPTVTQAPSRRLPAIVQVTDSSIPGELKIATFVPTPESDIGRLLQLAQDSGVDLKAVLENLMPAPVDAQDIALLEEKTELSTPPHLTRLETEPLDFIPFPEELMTHLRTWDADIRYQTIKLNDPDIPLGDRMIEQLTAWVTQNHKLLRIIAPVHSHAAEVLANKLSKEQNGLTMSSHPIIRDGVPYMTFLIQPKVRYIFVGYGNEVIKVAPAFEASGFGKASVAIFSLNRPERVIHAFEMGYHVYLTDRFDEIEGKPVNRYEQNPDQLRAFEEKLKALLIEAYTAKARNQFLQEMRISKRSERAEEVMAHARETGRLKAERVLQEQYKGLLSRGLNGGQFDLVIDGTPEGAGRTNKKLIYAPAQGSHPEMKIIYQGGEGEDVAEASFSAVTANFKGASHLKDCRHVSCNTPG